MATTPEATKGVPRLEGNPSATFRADFNTLADWALANVDSSVATTAALPASGNWKGRRRFVEADGRVRVHDGTNWIEPKALYCDLSRAAAISAGTTFASFIWDTEGADAPGWHSTVTNPERVTADRAGLYEVTFSLELSSISVAIQAILAKNGTGIPATQITDVGGGANSRAHLTYKLSLAAGDYVSVSFLAGSATAMVPARCFMQVTYLGGL